MFTPIIQRISQLIGSVMVQKPANLVSQRIWSKYCAIVQANLNSSREMSSLIDDIRRRNENLASATMRPRISDSAKRRLLHLLDEQDCNIRIDELSSACLGMIQDKVILIHELLKWSTSIYREGHSRVYLAANLIRRWHSIGIDTDNGILTFLAQSRDFQCCKEKLYLLLSELTTSNHFSIGRYLQWLIAKGALNNVHTLELVCHHAIHHPSCYRTD